MTGRRIVLVLGIVAIVAATYVLSTKRHTTPSTQTAARAPEIGTSAPKLYWFVPDGMRADPELFNVFRWAEEGRLPNIKKMMERGTYGFCKPAFPSHTPANFATLFTGAYPEVHGVNDGPMRAEGFPLSQIAIPGFSSVAKKVEPFWVTVENALSCPITLLSVPGSTPPELKKGNTIRGRWGRWGADFHSVNFQDTADQTFASVDRKAAKLFFMGAPLTQRISKSPAREWPSAPASHSPALEAALPAWGVTHYALISDSTDNGKTDYDTVAISAGRTTPICTLKPAQWSEWLPITLKWQLPGHTNATDVDLSVKIKLIRLETNGTFRLRYVYSALNKHLAEPASIAAELLAAAGPMVDFVDNFPPQLIFYPEDKATFLEEATLSLDWHAQAATFLLRKHQPSVYVQNIYTPNQMLTSRWWMGYVDPASARYNDVSAEERAKLWDEVHQLYKKLDDIVGRMLAEADADTFVVLSSDHGAVPLNRYVRLNNVFAREGLLKFNEDPQSGERVIDWQNTKAVFIQMQNVYINPNGLAGPWKRGSGDDYIQLRERVSRIISELADTDGTKPAQHVVTWEKVSDDLHLMPERSGDLVLANRAGFGWTEEMTPDLEVFTTPRITGYKQAIRAEDAMGLWTPFMIVGPGIAHGKFLGNTPIDMIDQYPTLMRGLGLKGPSWVQGKDVGEAWENPGNQDQPRSAR